MSRKMFRRILVSSALLALFLLAIMPRAQTSPAGEGWLSGWNYRRPIIITEQSGENLTDYQIGIFIDNAVNMNTNFSDLRFTDEDGSTLLDYWCENYNPAENATFWVKVPGIPANDNHAIYMYYDNPSATNSENGEATFEFYSDGSSLAGWTNSGATVNSTEGSPPPSLEATGETYAYRDIGLVPNRILEYDGYVIPGSIDLANLYFLTNSTGAGQIFRLEARASNGSGFATTSSWTSWAAPPTSNPTVSAGVWHHVKIVIKNTTADGYIDGEDSHYNGFSFTNNGGYIAVHGDAGIVTGGCFDDIRVRKYTSPEPTVSMGAEEVAIPSKPELQQPVNYFSTNDNTPTFQWISGQNADNHRLLVDNDASFGSPIENKLLGATANNYTLPDDNSLADGKYYWKVVAINPQGENSSDVWSFVVDLVPPLAPSLNSPENNDNTDDNYVTFSWAGVADNTEKTSNVSGIAHYELWVDEDPSFSPPLLTENTLDNSILSLTRELAGRLYWRVRAWDRAGNPGTFSEVRRLTVFSFSLSTSSTSLTVLRGNAGGATLSIDLVFGDQENVDLSYTWEGMEPTGITPSFDPPIGTVSFSSTLTFQTSSDASTGEFTCCVIATSESGITRNLDINIGVAGMSFFVLASPTSISLIRSDDATSTISVKFMMGTKENVELNGSWLGSIPMGVSATLDPKNSCPSYDSTLTFVTTDEASAGSFTYRVTGSGGGLTQWVDLTVNISTTVTVTLTTDKQNYEKGQRVQISGTAIDPKGNPVESGTTTITLRCDGWSDQLSAQIVDGAYADNYLIIFDRPEGDWSIFASAVDDRGNLGQASENVIVLVSIPASWEYYTVTFLSPVPGTVCSRGSEVTVTVQITGSPEKISGADVYLATPSGEIITLMEGSPGIYSTTYAPRWDDPVGEWTVSVLGEKTVQDVYKAGTGSTSLEIAPADLELELLEPAQRTFEVGEEVDVKVRVSYPDGSPVDGAIIIADLPNGENFTLLNEGEGIYRGAYSVSSKDLGAWGLTVSAVDAYGNSGTSSEVTLSVEELSPSSYPIRYWWITIPVALACVLVPLPTMIKKLRIRKLKSIKSEIRATEKLRRELPKRYFVKGAITREIYDSLMHQSMEKLMKMKKEARGLEKKLKK